MDDEMLLLGDWMNLNSGELLNVSSAQGWVASVWFML